MGKPDPARQPGAAAPATDPAGSDFSGRADVSALVLGAGLGLRMGLGPKAFLRVQRQTLLEHAVAAVAPFATEIIVGVPPTDVERARELLADTASLFEGRTVTLHVLAGGATRQETVTRLLAQATRPLVLLHEVARPYVTPELFRGVLVAADEGGAASLFLPIEVRDSLALARNGRMEAALPRSAVVTTQTPHAYRRELLLEAHRRGAAEGWLEEGTANLVHRAGYPITLVPGSHENVKLTYSSDLVPAQAPRP